MPNIFSKSGSRKMFTFAHLFKAAMVDHSKANLLTNEAAMERRDPLLRTGLEFYHGPHPRLAILLQNQSGPVQSGRQRGDLPFGPV
jgi:hypothetical protein